MERISIIIPVYNAYKYLDRCLSSVVNQTYPNTEIILINDCSIDNSNEICQNFLNRHDNICYYELNENKGVSYVRNFGIKKASGSLIGFVDSDDWIDKNMYSLLYQTMTTYNVSLVMCNYYYKSIENINKIAKTYSENELIVNKLDALKFCLFHKDFAVWNKLYKKELFCGIEFPIGKIYEDLYTFPLLVEKAGAIAICAKPLYYYIKRPGSITTKAMMSDGFDVIHGNISCYHNLVENCKLFELEKIFRKRIFFALIEVADRIVKEGANSILKNEYIAIRDMIYDKYSYMDCELDDDDLKVLRILKKGLRAFSIARKIKQDNEIE